MYRLSEPLKAFIRWFVSALFIGVVISFGVYEDVKSTNQIKINAATEKASQLFFDQLENNLTLYRNGVRSARGAIAVMGLEFVKASLFRRYSDARHINEEFPGIRGFGFIRKVPYAEEKNYVDQMRKSENSNFTIRQLSPHKNDRYVIEFIEPYERNSVAIGLDVASEIRRKLAADQAALTDEATLTSPITLVQVTGKPLQAFLIFLPIYKQASQPHELKNIFGWTYAALVMDEIIQSIDANKFNSEILLKDITTENEEFYKSAPATSSLLSDHSTQIRRTLLGRNWQLDFRASNKFIENLNLINPENTLYISLIFSFFVSALFGMLGIGYQQRVKNIARNAEVAAIVESAIDGIIGTTIDGIITSWNHGAEVIYGFIASEAIGKNISELVIPPELLQEERDIVYRLKVGQTTITYETVRQHKDGHYIDVAISIAPIYDESSRITGISRTIRDITDQKNNQLKIIELNNNLESIVKERTEELEQTRKELRTVLDAVPSQIGYWDKNLINKVANKAYENWFGVSIDVLKGKHMRWLLGDEIFKLSTPHIDAVLAGYPQSFEETIDNRKSMKHALVQYIPDKNSSGEVVGFYALVHDITEVTESKYKLAQLVRENKALLSTINKQMLYSVTDKNGIIIDANDRFCAFTGFDKKYVIGKNHNAFNSGMHPSSFWKIMWQTISTGNIWRNEICDKSQTGELHWFDTVISPYFDENGEIERYIALRSDITDRKVAEKQLNDLNLLFSNVLSAATQIGIIATNLEGIITLFNSGAEKLLGYKSTEVVNVTSPAIIHLNDEIEKRAHELTAEYGEYISGFRVFVHKAEIDGFETRQWTYVRKDGTQIQVDLTATPMRDAEKNIIGYLGIATDITERISNETEVIRARDQLIQAADIAGMGIWSWTFDDGMLEMNPRMFEIYSIQPADNTNRIPFIEWLQHLNPEDAAAATQQFELSVKNHEPFTGVFRVNTPSGKQRIIQSAALVEYSAQGEPIRATGINLDITDQQELENWLREAKESADAANAAKSAFLANMSHELRTPMNAVLGMLQLIQKTVLTHKQHSYLRKAETAAKSLLSILNDILDFSKIESGKLLIEQRPFDIHELLSTISIIISGYQNNPSIEVLFDMNGAIPEIVIGDRLRIQQVLINLTSNAIKFTQQGQIIVRLSIVKKQTNTVVLRFEVEDTGIGISDEQMKRLFESFSQAEASISRRFGGTGLGLVISKRLVNLMGGDLSVHSQYGVGSTFYFDLELGLSNQTLIEHSHTCDIDPQLRFLVIDDNEKSRQILMDMLQFKGCDADSTENTMEALSMIHKAIDEKKPYQIILIDSVMPGMNSIDLAEMIYKDDAKYKKPLILMMANTSNDPTIQRLEEPDAPFMDVLIKPFLYRQFRESVKNAISGHRMTKELIQTQHSQIQKQLVGLNILVVEDNALNRQIAEELLSIEGANIELAEDGAIGVSKVLASTENPYDVVIMDVQMPNMDGLEATRRIRENPDFHALPIIAMTANASNADRDMCIDAGMNDHIGKPIDIDELIPRLLQLSKKDAVVAESNSNKADHQKADNHDDYSTTQFDTVLKRFAFNVALLKKTLKHFEQESAALLHELNTHLMNGDRTGVLRVLHTLKGLCGTLGLLAAQRRALTLETLLKTSSAMAPENLVTPIAITSLESDIAEGRRFIERRIENLDSVHSKTSEVKGLSVPQLKELLLNMKQFLESGNLEVLDKADELRAKLNEQQQEAYEHFLNQVNTLEFSEALRSLQILLREVE